MSTEDFTAKWGIRNWSDVAESVAAVARATTLTQEQVLVSIDKMMESVSAHGGPMRPGDVCLSHGCEVMA